MVAASAAALVYGVPWWSSIEPDRATTHTSGCSRPLAAIQASGASSPPTNDRPSATSETRAFLTATTPSSASP